MDSFRWIAVVFSMLLGLGVTRLLGSAVTVFKSRAHSQLDWIPLLWALCIFIWQIQFWWAIIELSAMVGVWTLGSFLLMICLPLLLYISAALILPATELNASETLFESFEYDGRWALASLSLYFVLALLVDWRFWDVTPGDKGVFLLWPLMVLPVVLLCSKSRRVQEVITVLYLPLSIWAALELSPTSYV